MIKEKSHQFVLWSSYSGHIVRPELYFMIKARGSGLWIGLRGVVLWLYRTLNVKGEMLVPKTTKTAMLLSEFHGFLFS